MVEMPDHVTHYHRADRLPFLNLSDLPAAELTSVLADLGSPASRALSARRFGPRYMELRQATEARARQLFIDRGGRPRRSAPHYFVLGSSAWFAGLHIDVAEVRLPLVDLPPDVTSATAGDSISALGLGVPLGVPAPDPAGADRVYRLSELPRLWARRVPSNDVVPAHPAGYRGHQQTLVDAYVEIQLWSDEPVRGYLTGRDPDGGSSSIRTS